MSAAPSDHLSRLLEWLRAHGTSMPGCRAASMPGMGVGLVATKDLEVGELILSIPPDLWMTRKTKHSRFGPVIDAAYEAGLFSHTMSRLALLLVLERANPDSFFAPYLDALGEPTMPFEIEARGPTAPHSDDLVEWVREQALITAEEALGLSVALPKQFPDLVGPDVITLDSWRWAYGHAVQRSFSVDIDEEEVWVMVPGMDLCNHSSSVRNGYYAEPQGWQLEATQPWLAGEQIMIHYGPEKTSADFFLYYGFVPPHNPNDRVTLKLVLDPADPRYRQKSTALDVLGLRDTCRVGPDGVLPAAFRNAAVLWCLDARRFDAERLDFDDPRYESVALERIARAIDAHHDALPTSLNDDAATLEFSTDFAQAPILQYRVAFKGILDSAAASLRSRATDLRDGRVRPNAPDPDESEGRHALVTVEVPLGARA